MSVRDFAKTRLFKVLVLASLAAVLLALAGIAWAAAPTFNVTNYPNPAGLDDPWSVASADFDGDGDLDLAVANSADDNFFIRLNDGLGNFTTTTTTYAVGDEPRSIVAADFNGDGRPDIATANRGANTVTVRIKNGAGFGLDGGPTSGFNAPATYTVGSQPGSIFAADFDGVNGIDLVTANSASANVSVLLNDSTNNGTFSSATNRGVGSTPRSVVAGNFNGDNRPDLAVANEGSDTVSILLNNGSGGFPATPSSSPAVGDKPQSITTADFDNDGDLDLATANATAASDDVSVLLGNGSGTFTPASPRDYSTGNAVLTSITAADFDGDGKIDLALADDRNPDAVLVLPGNGTGTNSFGAANVYPLDQGTDQDHPQTIITADFNGDGAPDLATANTGGSEGVSVLLNTTPKADLSITKADSPDPVLAGQELTYTLTVTNGGPNAASNVVVTDTIPANTTFVSATPSAGGSCTNATGGDGRVTVTCTFPTLAGGATATVATIVVKPTANAAGTTLVNTASVSSSTAESNTANNSATATTTVPNRAPVAANDAYSTNEDTTLTVPAPGVLANDSDPDGNSITVGTPRPVSGPSNGTLALNADGSFTYTPNANFNGTDSFTYKACDDRPTPACSAPATVTITVAPVNDAPDAVDDTATTGEDAPVTVNVLSNDTDPDDDSLTISANTQGTNGTVSCDSTTCTYTPRADFNGTDSFTYTVSDGNGGTDTATVTITVTPANDPPVAEDDTAAAEEDGPPVTIDVLANDEDVDGDTLIISDFTQPPVGEGAVDCTDDECTYTPDADFNGTTTFEYTISDGNGGEDTATVTITVAPVNDAPVAAPDTYATNEDEPLTVDAPGVLGNDTDVEGDDLTAQLETGPSNGTLDLNEDGSFTYTPEADFEGTDSFTYTACDGTDSCSAPTTVTITVTAVNDAPVAVDDAYTTGEDEELTVEAPGVLGNDTDVEDDSLTAELVTGPSNGTLTLDPDGSFTYTPEEDFEGTDTFTYTANDGTEESNTATVTITVTGVNDDPVANDDAETTNEEEPVEVDVLANDADGDGDTLEVESYTQPENGEVTRNPDDTLTYTPDDDFSGTDTFEYAVSDGNGGTDTATVTITITPVNDAPVAATDLAATTDEDTSTTITLSGTDADGDELTFEVVEGPDHGTLGSIGTVSCTGTATTSSCSADVTYTPDTNYNGPDSFVYRVSDGNGGEDTATVTITVTPINDEPTASDDTATTNEDTPVTVDVLDNDEDVDGDTLVVKSFTQPENGTVECSPNGSCEYVPNRNFDGEDAFTYTVFDGTNSDTATVTITVGSENDAPVAVADSYDTNEDTTLEEAAPGVLGNDTDPDRDDELTAELVTGSFNGTVTLNPDGSFTYRPDKDFNGTDTFTYRACDDSTSTSSCSDPTTVTITVGPDNDDPVANDDAAATSENEPVEIDVLKNDADPEGDDLSAESFTRPENGEVTRGGDGRLVYTPNQNFDGTDTFEYTVSDGNGGTDTATVTVTVAGAVADLSIEKTDSPDPVNVGQNLTFLIRVSNAGPNAARDVEVADALPVNTTFISVTPSQGGDCEAPRVGETGTVECAFATLASGDSVLVKIIVKPTEAAAGTTLTNTVEVSSDTNDPVLADNSDTSTTLVRPVNGAVVAADDSYSVDEGRTLEVEAPGVLRNDTDVDENDDLSVTANTDPSNGSVEVNADGSFTYTPDENFTGTDTFTYTVCDNGDPRSCDEATVTITIKEVNEPPVAVNDSYNTTEDRELRVSAPGVLSNDTDPEDDTLTAKLVRGPRNGTLDLDANGSFTYKPNANFNGTDTFTYKANDGDDDSNTVTVTIVVTPQDEPDPRGCTITGTRGNDNMRGTSGVDVICGLGGNDTIYGLGGDDVIYGGPGRDRISGGTGKDRLFGEEGIDFLSTTDRVRGNDTANGGPDRDDCAGDRRDKRVSCP